MDRKTALEILDLDAFATFADAKKAYRNLAKQYHPDVVEKNHFPDGTSEGKMKDINLAFRYLAPLLTLDDEIKRATEQKRDQKTVRRRPKVSEKNKWDWFFSSVGEFFLNLNSVKESKTFEKKIKEEQPVKKRSTQKVNFEDVFMRVKEKDLHGEPKTGKRTGKNKPQKNDRVCDYRRYMTLKQKMKSGAFSRKQDSGMGSVNKIEPVKPVTRIGGN